MDYDTTNDLHSYGNYLSTYHPGTETQSTLLPMVNYEYNKKYITGIGPTDLAFPQNNVPTVLKMTNPIVNLSSTSDYSYTPPTPVETPTSIAADIKVGKSQTGKAKDMVSFLTNKGLSKEAAAGVVGNLMVESGLKTGVGGDKGTSFGLAQWRDPTSGQGRWTNLKNFTTNKGLDVNSVNGQMEYLWHELNNNYNGVLSRLQGAKTPEEAAELFRKHFENPAPNAKMESLRQQYARKFYNS